MRLIYQPLETATRTVPLGLRCVDIATRAQVSGGLSVTATPTDGRARASVAFLTRSGFYALQDLPGLHDFEFGDDSLLDAAPSASPPGREFAVFVEDTARRYLSYGMRLTLPRRRLMTTFLFPAPSSARTSGLLAIRGGLRDATRPLADGSPGPAGFARVEAQYEDTSPPTVYVGLADWRGEFALFLPEPNPLRPPAGVSVTSPNTSGRQTISQLRWPVTLRFFYEPQGQQFITTDERGRVEFLTGQAEGVTDVAPEAGRTRYFPVLPSLLNQSAAEVIPVAGASGPPAAALEAEIEFGKDMVARTQGAAGSGVWLVPPAVVSP
ncbi:MAG: hypothetical protein QOJ76_3152 [Acidobacteriota bacterium]|nr:hypothetical protein [Acidobacteriota bacterium]